MADQGHFIVRGKQLSSAPGKGQNSLSGVAYFQTSGIDNKSPDRVSTKRLTEILKRLGVKDPLGTDWDVELPNGVAIGHRASTSKVKAVRAKRSPSGGDKVVAAIRIPAPSKATLARKQVTPRPKTAIAKSA